MDAPKPDRRSARTRAALLAAFGEVLLDQGYEAMTVAQVADRANVGRSTLYEHFRTKDELLGAALRGPFEVLARGIDPQPDHQGLVALLDHFRSNAAVARILLTQPLRSRIARALAELLAARMAAAPEALPAQLCAIALAEGQLSLVDLWLRAYPGVDAGPVARALAAMCRPFARAA